MKRVTLITICAALIFPAIVFLSCVSEASAREGGAVFSDVEEKELFLSEVKSAGKITHIDRISLEADSMGWVYSISFHANEGRVSGMGAPNRFFGPYTVDANRNLSIGNLASTLMMAIKEPEDLKEHEYFRYLSTVTRWDIREGKLELYGSGGNGIEVLLVFVPK